MKKNFKDLIKSWIYKGQKFDDDSDSVEYNPDHSNMYDLFVKKTIDRFTNRDKMDKYYGDDKVFWNSTYEGPKVRKFTIPVGGLSREEAEDQIRELMSDYHNDVEWDNNEKYKSSTKPINRIYSELDPYGEEDWGDDYVNDKYDTFSKDYWMPSKTDYNINSNVFYKKFVIPV